MQKSVEILQDGYYHIYNRSNNKELLFKEERNCLYFMQLYEKYILPVADLLAYCLLPNHFHFFIKTKTFSSEEKSNRFSRGFSNMFNAYAKAINKSYKRDGSLFKERFRRKVIANDFHYANLIIYIHKNPVHHNLSANYKTYPYSSYHNYVSNTYNKLYKQEVLDWFGGIERFIRAHDGIRDTGMNRRNFLENERDE